MAGTTEGATLTREHRRRQTLLSGALSADVARLWAVFDPSDAAGSAEALSGPLRALTVQGRSTSAGLSTGYYGRFRVAEGVPGTFPPVAAAPLVDEAVSTSLWVTGLVGFKRAVAAGRVPVVASRIAMVGVSGAVSRMALDGGRSVVVGSALADPQASGWARVASGRACAFCAMLASRGPVYSADTADFDAHDHCSCAAEPVFGGYQWPATSQRYAELWSQSTGGLSGAAARNAFRRALDESS
jgi:hypothetical protein